MRRFLTASLLFAVFVSSAFPIAIASDNDDDFAADIIDLINTERAKADVPELKSNDDLYDLATIRAEESAQVFKHTRPNGKKYFSLFIENGISYRYVGENLAYGQKTPEEVIAAWMESPAHKSNILDRDFEYVGIGTYLADNGKMHYAVLFYTPKR